MDDYMFRSYVAEFKCVQEETSYLEIFNYTVSWLSALGASLGFVTHILTFYLGSLVQHFRGAPLPLRRASR